MFMVNFKRPVKSSDFLVNYTMLANIGKNELCLDLEHTSIDMIANLYIEWRSQYT